MRTTTPKDQRGFAHIFIVFVLVLAIAGVGFLAFQRIQDAKQANSTSNLPGTGKTTKGPLVVKSVEFSTTVDSVGKATAPSTTFTATDGKINVVATLQSPPKGTRIEFVRYRDNKFVDNGSLAITKEGAQYAGFDFTSKPGKKHPTGTYRVKIYANGVYQVSGTYSVK